MVLARRRRSRSISYFQYPSILECLGVQNANAACLSRTGNSFRRVKTFCEGRQSTSLDNLANEAEYTSTASQALSQSPLCNVSAPQLPESCLISRPISQDLLPIPGTNLSESVFSSGCQSINVSTCQMPPKLKFGQSISEVHSIGGYRGLSPLSHSLFIEYLTRVHMNKYPPSGELIRKSSESQSAVGDGSRSHSMSRVRKSGVTTTSSFIPPTSPPIILLNDFERGDSVSPGSSCTRDENKSAWACIFDGNVDLPFTHNFPPASDYRLKKLSTQMEVDQLRSMLREFERTHSLRTSLGRKSVSTSNSGAATPTSRKNSLDYFSLKNKSGSFSSLAFHKYSCTSVSKMGSAHFARYYDSISQPSSSPPCLQPPSSHLPTVQDSSAIELSPVLKSKNTSPMTRRLSHREHNILAPVSF